MPIDTERKTPSEDRYTCCQASDHHRSLILTQCDGTTEGFPLTWLYRWRWRKDPAQEVLTLTLTEHEVTIQGRHLNPILEHLRHCRGLHLQVVEQRYVSLWGSQHPKISGITIQSHVRTTTETKEA